ncbi:CMGC/CDK protein kinase [Spizellomyces punctatus DAOM BR117]|uniref:CMGC/CDK protein kinase n=1 Tax=Spizellomyces punctatus (strain DAOM BR117) TaxID=645134 RepID=A0A0L0HFX4_SPIPD|nr:CMGC/CDK protein kinase [Spizellomyces punctatus DAOM BR117]KNC99688.1 CMGC/CDK protein kinase [Spizellomyces punctatus DAOM BR117]|eukprot:XP_016607728.1 CMGC/CDK protein kinase [Spizellomyces punctatus DAOM BR117]
MAGVYPEDLETLVPAEIHFEHPTPHPVQPTAPEVANAEGLKGLERSTRTLHSRDPNGSDTSVQDLPMDEEGRSGSCLVEGTIPLQSSQSQQRATNQIIMVSGQEKEAANGLEFKSSDTPDHVLPVHVTHYDDIQNMDVDPNSTSPRPTVKQPLGSAKNVSETNVKATEKSKKLSFAIGATPGRSRAHKRITLSQLEAETSRSGDSQPKMGAKSTPFLSSVAGSGRVSRSSGLETSKRESNTESGASVPLSGVLLSHYDDQLAPHEDVEPPRPSPSANGPIIGMADSLPSARQSVSSNTQIESTHPGGKHERLRSQAIRKRSFEEKKSPGSVAQHGATSEAASISRQSPEHDLLVSTQTTLLTGRSSAGKELRKVNAAVVKERQPNAVPRDLKSPPKFDKFKIYRSIEAHFQNLEQIGQGTFGTVFKARIKHNGQIVALKQIIDKKGKNNIFTVPNMREFRFLMKYRHRNILQCIGMVSYDKPQAFGQEVHEYMILEYMDHDLAGLMQHHPDKQLYKLNHLKCIAKQMFEGMHYMHSKGVMHRDLKVGNLLLNNRGELKIADFGFAREKDVYDEKGYTNRVCTVWYRPLEVLLGQLHYGYEIDMWGAGCILAEMFIKYPIFHTSRGRDTEQVKRIFSICGHPTDENWQLYRKMDHSWSKMWLKPKQKYPRRLETYLNEKAVTPVTPMAVDLISRLLSYDPSQRPSAKEALDHPFFKTETPTPCLPKDLPVVEGSWHEYECKERIKQQKGGRKSETNFLVTGAKSAPTASKSGMDSTQDSQSSAAVTGRDPSSADVGAADDRSVWDEPRQTWWDPISDSLWDQDRWVPLHEFDRRHYSNHSWTAPHFGDGRAHPGHDVRYNTPRRAYDNFEKYHPYGAHGDRQRTYWAPPRESPLYARSSRGVNGDARHPGQSTSVPAWSDVSSRHDASQPPDPEAPGSDRLRRRDENDIGSTESSIVSSGRFLRKSQETFKGDRRPIPGPVDSTANRSHTDDTQTHSEIGSDVAHTVGLSGLSMKRSHYSDISSVSDRDVRSHDVLIQAVFKEPYSIREVLATENAAQSNDMYGYGDRSRVRRSSDAVGETVRKMEPSRELIGIADAERHSADGDTHYDADKGQGKVHDRRKDWERDRGRDRDRRRGDRRDHSRDRSWSRTRRRHSYEHSRSRERNSYTYRDRARRARSREGSRSRSGSRDRSHDRRYQHAARRSRSRSPGVGSQSRGDSRRDSFSSAASYSTFEKESKLSLTAELAMEPNVNEMTSSSYKRQRDSSEQPGEERSSKRRCSNASVKIPVEKVDGSLDVSDGLAMTKLVPRSHQSTNVKDDAGQLVEQNMSFPCNQQGEGVGGGEVVRGSTCEVLIAAAAIKDASTTRQTAVLPIVESPSAGGKIPVRGQQITMIPIPGEEISNGETKSPDVLKSLLPDFPVETWSVSERFRRLDHVYCSRFADDAAQFFETLRTLTTTPISIPLPADGVDCAGMEGGDQPVPFNNSTHRLVSISRCNIWSLDHPYTRGGIHVNKLD